MTCPHQKRNKTLERRLNLAEEVVIIICFFSSRNTRPHWGKVKRWLFGREIQYELIIDLPYIASQCWMRSLPGYLVIADSCSSWSRSSSKIRWLSESSVRDQGHRHAFQESALRSAYPGHFMPSCKIRHAGYRAQAEVNRNSACHLNKDFHRW